MELNDFLENLNTGKPIIGGSSMHRYMQAISQEALKITAQLNNQYHTPDRIQILMSQLIGKEVPASFALFPPFSTNCGKNITIRENVFINSGCCFQDQGGITLGNDVLIGPNVVLATLNHDYESINRETVLPAPITIEDNVWIGANATILPGVIIGKNAVVAAGAVVNKDVPPNTVVGGVPAKVLKYLSIDKS